MWWFILIFTIGMPLGRCDSEAPTAGMPLGRCDSEAPTAGNSYTFRTDNYWYEDTWNDYKVFWMKPFTDKLVFWIRSCYDGHVLITEEFMNLDPAKAIEFDIGAHNNTELIIYRGGRHGTRRATSPHKGPFTDCHEWRRYWISWRNGEITIGSRSHGVVSYHDIINVNYIGFTAGGATYDDWAIDEPEKQVQDFTIITPGNTALYTYDSAYIVTKGFNHVVFKVKACSRAGVILMPVLGASSIADFQVVIGVQGPRGVEVRDQADGYSKEVDPGDSLLSCDILRTFWILWDKDQNKYVRVGKGDQPGKSQLIHFTPRRTNWRVAGVSFQILETVSGEFVMVTSGDLKNIPGDSLSGGAIFGIIVGSVVLAILIGGVVILLVPGVRDKAGSVYDGAKGCFGANKTPATLPTQAHGVGASGGIDPVDIMKQVNT